jgi:hypothetical protein
LGSGKVLFLSSFLSFILFFVHFIWFTKMGCVVLWWLCITDNVT